MASVLLDDLLLVKYEHNGRGPNYDCLGLLIEVARRHGIMVGGGLDQMTPEENHLAFVNGVSVFSELPKPENFCIVLLAPHIKYTTHCGFVLEWPRFIHCWEKTNVTIERLDSLFWKPRVRGYYR